MMLTWNSDVYVEACLQSVIDATEHRNIRCEIFVIDNGSVDNTVGLLKDYAVRYPDIVKPIYLDHNTGTTYPRNLGLKQAKGKHIVVMDSDMEINEDTIPTLLQVMAKNPEAGLLAPKLVYGSGALQKSTDQFPTIFRKIYRYLFLKNIEKEERKNQQPSSEEKIDYAISAFWFFERDLLSSVGLLDENYFYAPEDVDYCLRVWKSKRQILYVPQASAIHFAQEISRGFTLNKAMIEHIKGLAYYFWKHRYFFRRPKFY